MLPENLVSVYKQYKEDTNAVAAWLACTAKSCGYSSDLLPGGPSQAAGPERSKRLKGKARKEAKATSAQSQASSSDSSRPEYTIAIKDFVPLAEFVAASKKPVISVPQAFATTLNRVIAARSRFSARLVDLDNSTDHASDCKHSYFVGVLEEVRRVLQPRFPPASQDAISPHSTSDPLDEVGGRFATLSVYEPSEDFLNAPDLERPTPVKKENANYVAESVQELNEAIFAYSLLMKDLWVIRDRIKWIWTNYREGALELVAAAIATNTACDLARNLTEDMTPIFKANGGAGRIAKFFYVHACTYQGYQFDEVINSENQFNHGTYEIANDTYMTAFILLNNFLAAIGPSGGLPFYRDTIFAPYDPTLDWGELSSEEKLEQDISLMMETMAELVALVRYVPSYPVNDEFIRGVKELDQTREIPMHLAFAAQIFLDIHHVLRGRVYSAHETCMSHMGLMDEDLAMHIDFHAKLPAKTWTASETKLLKELRMVIKWVQDDPIHGIKVKISSRQGILYNAPIHRILRYSPVISGLMLYHFRARTYILGLSLANSWGSIIFPLHLWNALRHEDLLPPPRDSPDSWEDMAMAQAMLGIGSFFVGSQIPTSPRDYAKHLALQMGISPALFSKDRHMRMLTPEKVRSKAGARHIKEDSTPVTVMFFNRYVGNTGQVDWTPEHVDSIISRSLFEEKYLDNGVLTLGKIDDPEKLRARKRENAAVNRKTRESKCSRIPPDRLIRSLAMALQAESPTLTFPYLTLQRVAWGMLRAVHEACEPLLSTGPGPKISDDESHLPRVVSQILVALALGNDKPFVRAGEVVRDHVRQGEGSKAIQRLESMGYKVIAEEESTSTLLPPGTFPMILRKKRR